MLGWIRCLAKNIAAILVQLLDESKVRICHPPPFLNVLKGLGRGPIELGHEKSCNDADTPADPFCAMH